MAYDEKQFLELLQEYKSDETKKARRNVSLIAFIVFAAAYLSIPVAEIQLLGMRIPKEAELRLMVIAGVLLIYWAGMFVLSWVHDREIQRERSRFLKVELDRLRARFKYGEEKMKETGGQRVPTDYSEVKTALDIYAAQRLRTQRAAITGLAISKLEFHLPLAMAAGAGAVLVVVGLRVL